MRIPGRSGRAASATNPEESTNVRTGYDRASIRASRSRFVEFGPGALPASGDAVLVGDASRALRRGVHEFMAYYGTLIDTMETQYVNGFAYNAMRPAPENEIPERFARAEVVWEQKVWREQLREWDETAKPAAIRTHLELQSVDADALSDDGLVAYLTRCRDHHSQMMFQHMRFTGSAMLPVGDLLAHLGTWTGVAPAEALGMMRGATPVSAGASGELDRLIAAITKDTTARALLDSDGDPGKVLAELRAFGGGVGTAMSEYLDLVGCRLLDGFDISGRYALELPDVLLRAIRSSVDGRRQ